MRAVLDSNIWVSAFITPEGPPGQVVQAVRDGRVRALASWILAAEIADVLQRPRVRKYMVEEPDFKEIMDILAPLLPHLDITFPIRDPKDFPVVASAIVGHADAIVTGDDDLLDDAPLRALLAEKGIEVLTPGETLARLPGGGSPRRGGGGARRAR